MSATKTVVISLLLPLMLVVSMLLQCRRMRHGRHGHGCAGFEALPRPNFALCMRSIGKWPIAYCSNSPTTVSDCLILIQVHFWFTTGYSPFICRWPSSGNGMIILYKQHCVKKCEDGVTCVVLCMLYLVCMLPSLHLVSVVFDTAIPIQYTSL